jgi:hypothetical protein
MIDRAVLDSLIILLEHLPNKPSHLYSIHLRHVDVGENEPILLRASELVELI